MNLDQFPGTGLLVQHVNILSDDALEKPLVLQSGERLVNRARLALSQSVNQGSTTLVINGGVTPEPIDVEDALRVGLLIESLGPPEIGNTTQG